MNASETTDASAEKKSPEERAYLATFGKLETTLEHHDRELVDGVDLIKLGIKTIENAATRRRERTKGLLLKFKALAPWLFARRIATLATMRPVASSCVALPALLWMGMVMWNGHREETQNGKQKAMSLQIDNSTTCEVDYEKGMAAEMEQRFVDADKLYTSALTKAVATNNASYRRIARQRIILVSEKIKEQRS